MINFYVDNLFTSMDNPYPLSVPINKYLNIKKGTFYKGIDYDELRITGRTVLKTKYKTEHINVYNAQNRSFPSGRLGYLIQYCKDNGITYKINDIRKKPKKRYEIKYTGPQSDGSDGKPPRIYQLEAPDIIEKRGGRGILWDATGSGKTCTGAIIIHRFGVNTLYMVPSIELLNQTIKSLQRMLSIDIGKIGDGTWDPKPVTVATTATLWSRFETPECKNLLQNTEMLIIDECHHLSYKEKGKTTKNKKGKGYQVNSWYLIAIQCPAYYRIGLTGTPGKDVEEKRALLECAIGRVVRKVTAKELIDIGVLCDVEIHMHTIHHPYSYGDYHSSRKEGVLLNEKLNEYIVHVAIAELKQGANVLIVTGSKAHQGPAIKRILEQNGYDVPFISGDTKSKSRILVRDEFAEGKRNILIGTVYKEGVDFPFCDVGILCDGGHDEKGTCQFLGRILRSAKGKKIARLHDFMHENNRFLKRHSNARLNEYIEQDIENIITHKGIKV